MPADPGEVAALKKEVLGPGWQTWAPVRKRAVLRGINRRAFVAQYEWDPVAFAHDCFDWPEGQAPTEYQDEILAGLLTHGREAVRGPHGLGKTMIEAVAILWFAETRDAKGDDWKIPTTASKGRQLSLYLWPEVHKWARRLRWDLLGREPYDERTELQVLGLKLNHGEAFAASPSDPAGIEGAHADRLLYVYDEAKTITRGLFEASEGAFAGAGPDTGREALGLAGSTPGSPEGPFYEMHRRSPEWAEWHPIHVTLEQSISAGRISATWAEAKRKGWGEASAIYANRVLGEFKSDVGQVVIPLEWIEDAHDRWHDLAVQRTDSSWFIPPGRLPKFSCVGVDVAEEGEDQTVLALRFGDVIDEIRAYPLTPDSMVTAGYVTGVLRKWRGLGQEGYAVVDYGGGYGSGPGARVKEQGYRVVAFKPAARSAAHDESGELELANLRAEAWWGLRERLDPSTGATLALPPIDELTGDLTAPTRQTTSAGRILVEAKEDIRKRLGRSTDFGDAVVMACWNPHVGATVSRPSDTGIRLPGVAAR